MPAPLRALTAVACPLLRDNVDTDALIPTSENTRASSTGYGDALFAAWRYRDVPSRTPDPDFVLNQAPYARSEILLSGSNFGCGSSRESAVWALRDFGFRIVIAESFNETFQRNCVRNGLAPLAIARAALDALARTLAGTDDKRLRVDLRKRVVAPATAPSAAIGFALDDFERDLLMRGATEDDLLASLAPDIDATRDDLAHAWPWLRPGTNRRA